MSNVVILYHDDGLANSQRANWLYSLLQQKGVSVRLVYTPDYLEVRKRYFHPPLEKVFYYYFRKFFLTKWLLQRSRRKTFFQKLEFRAKMLSQAAFIRKAKVIICQNNLDFLVGLKKSPKQVFIFDSPTPYSYEIEYSSDKKQLANLAQIREQEKKVYQKANKVIFNWKGYKTFFEEASGIKINNYLIANSGTTSPKHFSTFAKNKRIIFVGSLDDYWVNPLLLKELLKISKLPIDVYGKTSDPFFLKHSSYKGYLKPSREDILSKYHFGLISISNDPLRNKGFSAKQMLYLSYGLPLLVPEWRQDPYFESATIQYNVKNFNAQLESFSSFKKWQEKHKAALLLAKENTWESNLKELVQYVVENEKK